MATTLPRPHSADFSSLGLSPAFSPARARPKSQTFRSSPLAGPALSITELATEKVKGKGDSPRPPSLRASTTPPRVTVTLAELGAVRTTKGSVAFPHKRPSPSITDAETSSAEKRRYSSVSFASTSSLRPPRVPFASESGASHPKPRPQSILSPEQHWLTTAQTPAFSRSSLYTQNIIMPVRAPRTRKSTSSSASSARSSQVGPSSGKRLADEQPDITSPSDSSSSTSSSATPSRQSSSTSLSSSVRSGRIPERGSSDALSFTPRRRKKSAEGQAQPAFPTTASADEVDTPAGGNSEDNFVRRRTLSQRLSILVRSKSVSRSKSVRSVKSTKSLKGAEDGKAREAQDETTVETVLSESPQPSEAPYEFLKHDPALQHSPTPPPSPPAGHEPDPPLKKRFSLKLPAAVSASVTSRRRSRTITPAICVHPVPHDGVSTVDNVEPRSGDAAPSKKEELSEASSSAPDQHSQSRRHTILGISRSFMSDLNLLSTKTRHATATGIHVTEGSPTAPNVASPVVLESEQLAPKPSQTSTEAEVTQATATIVVSAKEPTLRKSSSRSFSLRIPGGLLRLSKKGPGAKKSS